MTKSTMSGVVYVLESTGKPGICKVGRTTRTATKRALELEAARGYSKFGPWRVVEACSIPNCAAVEAEAHRRLRRYRVRLNYYRCRELFRVTPEQACRAVAAAACHVAPPIPPPFNPWARPLPRSPLHLLHDRLGLRAAISLAAAAIVVGLLYFFP